MDIDRPINQGDHHQRMSQSSILPVSASTEEEPESPAESWGPGLLGGGPAVRPAVLDGQQASQLLQLR